MQSWRKNGVKFLVNSLILLSLLFSQGTRTAGAFGAVQRQAEPPIQKQHLVDTLKWKGLTKDKLLHLIAERGIDFPLGEVDEHDLRRAGAYLGAAALDELITSVRLNYLNARIDETVMLTPGKTSHIKGLGFKINYVKREGDEYVIIVGYPGADQVELQARANCKYDLRRGHRNFTLDITRTSSKQATILLTTKVKKYGPYVGGVLNAPPLPKEEIIHPLPCLPIKMKLVDVAGDGSQRRVAPFYISEPLTVGVLRYYSSRHTPKTPIPLGAKDSDPIIEIDDEDAHDIATMLGTRLPSFDHLLGAHRAGALTTAEGVQLVGDGRNGLLTIQLPAGTSFGPTTTSPQIIIPKIKTEGPVKGFFRVIRDANPTKGVRQYVEPNKPGPP